MPEIFSRQEAGERCDEIFAQVGDVQTFRERGQASELDEDELVLDGEQTSLTRIDPLEEL